MKIDKELAILYGIMLGDGCLSKHNNKKGKKFYFISISGNYKDDKPFYDKIVLPLINNLRKNEKTIKYKEREKYGKIEINFSDKFLFGELNKIGFPNGKKGSEIKIPTIFYKKKLLKYLTQGFFATDGSLVLTKNPNKIYPRLEGHGISDKLIFQIKDYLVSRGMYGKFYECKRNKHPFKNFQKQYRFQFNGQKNLNLFQEKIGFINPKHLEKLSNFLKYSKDYDLSIKGIPTQKQRVHRDKILMATPRIELGTSCS